VARDAADLAAGVIGPEEAVSARLWPDEMIRATVAVLDHRWEAATDAEVLEVVERTVRALNGINRQLHGAAYETLLCADIDRVLGGAGVEPDELARRNGLPSSDITEPWRDW
jgi:hypothetical protein